MVWIPSFIIGLVGISTIVMSLVIKDYISSLGHIRGYGIILYTHNFYLNHPVIFSVVSAYGILGFLYVKRDGLQKLFKR